MNTCLSSVMVPRYSDYWHIRPEMLAGVCNDIYLETQFDFCVELLRSTHVNPLKVATLRIGGEHTLL